MDLSDIIYAAYFVICLLIAVSISGGGGGKRSRVPASPA